MAGRGQCMTSPKMIAAAERARLALEARKSGATYDQIAKQLGYRGPDGAHRAVKRALIRLRQEPADDVRALEIARLDRLLMGQWRAAIGTAETPGDPAAVDRVLKIMARRAAYLGLDAPVVFSVQQVVTAVAAELGMTDEETAATVADLEAMLASKPRTP